ncbi:MAG: DUF2431 domain-containing protein [Candidatus Pacearchaeota archaeon]|nr:DUF2431 domain-containing protein [Candidatus Pacearchaeota archaeon]
MLIYQPREDSYLLQKQVKKYAKNKSVLDIGSGSGIQALSAIESGAKSVLATDINDDAISFLKSQNINAIKSNLFSKIKKTEKFDLIVFNPPYLPREKKEDKESALSTTGGKMGDEIILRFLKQAKSHINKKGIILIVLSSLTPKDRIINLLKNKKMKYKVISRQHLFFETLEVWEIKIQTNKNPPH